jgi:voltage-gated potassium channel
MDERSTRVAQALQTPMLIAAALTLPAVAIGESHPGGWLEDTARVLNWVTWLAFLAELVIMLAVVPDRRGWLRRHPLEVAIVLLTPPVLPPSLQSLRVVRLLRLLRVVRLARLSREVFSLEGLRYAALLVVLTALAGGLVFDAFERHHQHLSTWESVYWATTTMTTLGSDIYPTTIGGEVVAVVIVLVGVAFVALLTGAVAQRFLGPEISATEAELELGVESAEAEAIRRLDELRAQLNSLEVVVGRIVSGRADPPKTAD